MAVVLCVAVLVAFWVALAFANETFGFDFRGTLWDAAIAVREGRSPYPSPVVAEVDVGNPALYPPLLMLLVLPLTYLPWSVGIGIWTLLQALAIVASLAILRVRDVRCFALALLSVPVLQGLLWGNAALLLVPLVALAWRWRDRAARVGVVVGLALGAKLFLWPLLAWLVGTRRYRAAVYALCAGLGAILVPWAAIDFVGLRAYPELLRVAEDVYATHSYSVATIAAGLGVVASAAVFGSLVAGTVGAGVALLSGRRGLDEVAFSVAILGSILGSPIVWEYYYALLLIPLAIVWPRFSGVWVAALALSLAAHLLPLERLPAAAFEPGGAACCKPPEIPLESWAFNHSPPALWPALGHASLALVMTLLVTATLRHRRRMGSQRQLHL